MKRFTSASAVILGDGVRLPAATSSSGGVTIELLKTPNISKSNKPIDKSKVYTLFGVKSLDIGEE
ncbi:hypothetical protein A4A49_46487 [Nicotiana attenuata]|uniref:Uncharacterized protein n=1 Tax=Nicotiana attenuata TaxID=49451 RepID=A0A1J6KSE3_NICAT|nr:hypothetical protein A4A49_46487 [Nicotiana attenuata]